MAAGNVGGLAPMGLGVMAIQLGQKERALIYSSPTADCLQRRRRIFPPFISASTGCKDSNLGTHHICNAAGCWRNGTRGKENLHASAASCSGCWQPRASTHVCVCVRATPSSYQLGSGYEGAADALNAPRFSAHVSQR